ncbi:MAG: DUF192 domain-containing protein [Cyanobacteriota bacterium]|nr:DUF192 domain-containing protein [Cyanobacteriota bacterium]
MAEIQGTPGIDFLDGTFDSDTIFALGGNDAVQGLENFDFIAGNEGNDVLRGNGGGDTIYGGKDEDSLYGGEDNDLLLGDRGNDLVLGEFGRDTIYGGKDRDSLYGGEGNDLLLGDRGDDLLVGEGGRDTLTGGEGSDRFVIGRGGEDAIVDFGNGLDQIVLTDGLQFGELNIFEENGNLVIQEEGTQENLAVLLGVGNIDESSFISLVGGLEEGQVLPIAARTSINGQSIDLEVAQSPLEQAVGLMFRSNLAGDRGMLFPLNPPRVANFWMRNVFINLDMVFVRDGVVEAVFANVPPCFTETCPTYGPETVVDGVIELRGGRAQELGLQVGDRVDVELLG